MNVLYIEVGLMKYLFAKKTLDTKMKINVVSIEAGLIK